MTYDFNNFDHKLTEFDFNGNIADAVLTAAYYEGDGLDRTNDGYLTDDELDALPEELQADLISHKIMMK